jgi:Glycosyltransferase family 87
MASIARKLLPAVAVLAGCAWMASMVTSAGDWPLDSWPAIHALIGGEVGDYLSAKAMMGPFSTLIQAPFAAVAPPGHLSVYIWASTPCLLAAGLVGLYLGSIAARRGVPLFARVLIAFLCVVNPLVLSALQNGHPEEILTAALVVGAIAAAGEGKTAGSAVLLGLALASKQWAVLAILPTLMALPRFRLRVGVAAIGIAVLFTAPSVVASPESFTEVSGNAANTGWVVTPWSIWYPGASVETKVVGSGQATFVAEVHHAPPLVGDMSHPFIVLLAFAVPLSLAARRRSFRLSGGEAMGLLALVALLRCALDPVDNVYYHLPLLMALIGWDAFACRNLPWRALLGTSAALVFSHWADHLTDPLAYNFAYIALAAATGAVLVFALWRPQRILGSRRLHPEVTPA